ncbi:hypothetical protein WJX74_002537 [Apatococcus lobatus]|uniref:Uncharacterized protein n=1 Tax=Apatococcus lobatus TaxID=904363 RepID=A0AAW1SAG1_9CHLO
MRTQRASSPSLHAEEARLKHTKHHNKDRCNPSGKVLHGGSDFCSLRRSGPVSKHTGLDSRPAAHASGERMESSSSSSSS